MFVHVVVYWLNRYSLFCIVISFTKIVTISFRRINCSRKFEYKLSTDTFLKGICNMENQEDCGPESDLRAPKQIASKLSGKSLVREVTRTFKCGEKDCNKTYTSKTHLDRHIHSVHIKPEFPILYSCPECLNTYSNRQNLNRHLKRIHNSVKSYKCDVCGDNFKKKHLLTTHMYKHTFIKAFSCKLCEKEFVSHLERKKHMRYHKTYSCEHCNVVFNHWTKYLKHRRMDHQFSEFICDDCGRKFKKRDHIIRHIKTHSVRITPKIHVCPYEDCDRSYTRNSNLKQHIKIKHMEIKHKCDICDAQLSTKAKLNIHLNAMHLKPKLPKVRSIANGRRERKDKGGIKKTCTALRISGLIIPDDESVEKTSEELLTPIVCERPMH